MFENNERARFSVRTGAVCDSRTSTSLARRHGHQLVLDLGRGLAPVMHGDTLLHRSFLQAYIEIAVVIQLPRGQNPADTTKVSLEVCVLAKRLILAGEGHPYKNDRL